MDSHMTRTTYVYMSIGDNIDINVLFEGCQQTEKVVLSEANAGVLK